MAAALELGLKFIKSKKAAEASEKVAGQKKRKAFLKDEESSDSEVKAPVKKKQPKGDKGDKATKPTKIGDKTSIKKARTAKTPTGNDDDTNDAIKGSKPIEQVKGLSEPTLEVLKAKGFTSLMEIQHKCFTHVFAGKDTVGRAKTGCGKTLAFCLPIVERIVADKLSGGSGRKKVLMLAMAPTRELAKQIHVELDKIASAHKLVSTCLYGGTPFGPQCDEIRRGLDAVVATPGRVLDHLRRETLSLEAMRFFVLDEADEMLSMGFHEDVEEILTFAPEGTQKLLFSATMPKWVKSVIEKHLEEEHVVVDVVGEGAASQANLNIRHECISCSPTERGNTLADLCKAHAGQFGKTLVFTETKRECEELFQNQTLITMGAGMLHGDIPQNAREATMENFRMGRLKLLIATDVAARGLDVPNVDLVVMTRPPKDLDTYVHRSGRTARAGRTGTCIVFYARNEEYLLRLLQHKKNIKLHRRGPAQPAEVVAQAARDAVRQLDIIHQENVDAFTKVAEELLAERESPVFLLAASLAAMTGYTDRIKTRSLLSSVEGFQAIILESEKELQSSGQAWTLLRRNVSEAVAQQAKGMVLVKGWYSAVFDAPQELVTKILKAECWDKIKFSVAEELPELETGSSIQEDMRMHKAQQQRWRERLGSFKSNRGKGDKGDKGDGKGGGFGKGGGGGRGFGGGDGGGKGKGGGGKGGKGGGRGVKRDWDN